MSRKSRRQVLLGLSVGAPALWAKPVVDSVLLPVHAQTTTTESAPVSEPQVETRQFSDTQTYVYNDSASFNEGISQIDCSEASDFYPNGPTFDFNVAGMMPAGNGTLTVNVVGDVESIIEFYVVSIDGVEFAQTVGGSGSQCTAPGVTEVLSIPMAQLQNAAQGGTIQVIAQPDGDVDCWCGPPNNNGPDLSSVTVTLEFPYTS